MVKEEKVFLTIPGKEPKEVNLSQALRTKETAWIHINTITNNNIIKSVSEKYNLHPLTIEDIKTPRQRPKIEEYEKYTYIVLRLLNEIKNEQLSIVVSKNKVITFQQTNNDFLSSINQRITKTKGTDYITYLIMDKVVDKYFDISEQLADKVEKTENSLLQDKETSALSNINQIKKHLTELRKAAWPIRDIINKLEITNKKFVKKETKVYFRDIQDHALQIVDSTESLRERTSSTIELHISNTSNRTNDVMKVLTVISTIFIPLTFITGIYGMNFRFMPEIGWLYGYPLIIGIMIIIGIIMLIAFKKKKWI